MSKERQPNTTAGAQEATPATSNWFLPNFMAVTNSVGLRPTVTLNVGGLLVSGELIDARTYFSDLAALTNEGLKDAISQGALDQLDALFAAFRDRADHPGNAAEQSASHEPTHLHLRNARVYQPGGTPAPAAGGVSWRVRLDAVDGFSLDMPALR
jgi:hypothetical protein